MPPKVVIQGNEMPPKVGILSCRSTLNNNNKRCLKMNTNEKLNKETNYSMRLTEVEKDQLQRLAKAYNLPLSKYLIFCGLGKDIATIGFKRNPLTRVQIKHARKNLNQVKNNLGKYQSEPENYVKFLGIADSINIIEEYINDNDISDKEFASHIKSINDKLNKAAIKSHDGDFMLLNIVDINFKNIAGMISNDQ